MLRNIIFDMGGVLIRWDPPYFIERLGITDPADRELLLREVYHSPQWRQTDLGTMTEQELETIVLPRLPERLRDVAHQLIFHWSDPVAPIPGMAELVRDLKAAGMNLYLLSNASRRQPEYWVHVPGHEYFDGTVVSGFLQLVKPSPDIYNHLLTTYHCQAQESLFVDDTAVNVEAARALGMDGFVFTGDADALRRYLAPKIPQLSKP